MDNTTDVFVFFTGAVCRLCEEFYPTFISAAKVLNKSPKLLFTTINVSENELEEHDIHYYPTVRFYPTNSKFRPFDYDQGIEL